MSVLVFGKSGQVAQALAQCDDVICAGRDIADFAAPDQCLDLIAAQHPDLIINAAAYTAVDQAEDEELLATQINAVTPGLIAQRAADLSIPFVHISTDYVFDGSGDTPLSPNLVPNPLGAYGRSKADGEARIRQANGPHAIIRTSWVFSATGSNFVKTMLRLGETRDSLTVVNDQIGGPTPARAIADMAYRVGKTLCDAPEKTGTYHFSGQPFVSWADFARATFAAAGMKVNVTDIPSRDYPTKAARPHNSRLDGSSLKSQFGIGPADWQSDLATIVADLKAKRT